MLTLRPYQTKFAHDMSAALAEQRRAGLPGSVLGVLPTGGGKSVVIAHVASNARTRGFRSCVLCHRIEICQQIGDKLGAFDVPHAFIAAGQPERRLEKIQIAMAQTLVRRLERWTDAFDLFLIDEAHHTAADTWARILAANADAAVTGYTATGERGDKSGLGGIFRAIVIGPTTPELQAQGFLAKHCVYAPATIDVRGLRTAHGDYDQPELAQRASRLTGDAIAHYKRLAEGMPFLAFCVSVAHAEQVAERFRDAGYRCVCVHGKTPADERAKAIADLGGGRITGMTCCGLFDEGLDLPGVFCGIMLRPTQSRPVVIQQTGRVLRPFPGKSEAIILDHAGNFERHGWLPDVVIDWRLEAPPQKFKAAQECEPALRIRRCERCAYVHAWAASCPACGYEYPAAERIPETRDGELRRLTAIQKRAKEVEAVRRRTRVQACRSEEELRALGREWGYKATWAYFQARRRHLPRWTPKEEKEAGHG